MATLRSEVLTRIKKLMEGNHHTAARVLGAQTLGDMQLSKKFELVGKLEALEGTLPNSLAAYRRGLYGDLMALAKQKFRPKDYAAFRAAY